MKIPFSLPGLAILFLSQMASAQPASSPQASSLSPNGLAPAVRIAQFDGDRAAAISYTFDDNLRDQYTVGVPMLNQVGFKGTFFVIPGATAETPEEGAKKETQKRAWGGISWPELKEMAAQGHEIASHTWSHPNLKNLSPEELDAQLSKAYEAIKTRVGKEPLTLAFPFNASTPEVQAAALRYYVAYRSYQTATSAKTTAESLNTWADQLVKEKKWGVVMTHAVANGYSAMADPEVFRAHLNYVKNHRREIWVDTFANIARYEKEKEAAQLTVTKKAGGLTCLLSSPLDAKIYDVPLTLVIDAKGCKTATAERSGQKLPARVENGAIYVQAAPSPQPIAIAWK